MERKRNPGLVVLLAPDFADVQRATFYYCLWAIWASTHTAPQRRARRPQISSMQRLLGPRSAFLPRSAGRASAAAPRGTRDSGGSSAIARRRSGRCHCHELCQDRFARAITGQATLRSLPPDAVGAVGEPGTLVQNTTSPCHSLDPTVALNSPPFRRQLGYFMVMSGEQRRHGWPRSYARSPPPSTRPVEGCGARRSRRGSPVEAFAGLV